MFVNRLSSTLLKGAPLRRSFSSFIKPTKPAPRFSNNFGVSSLFRLPLVTKSYGLPSNSISKRSFTATSTSVVESQTQKPDFGQTRSDLTKMLEKEMEGVLDLPSGKEVFDEYVKSVNATVTMHKGKVTAKSVVNGYDVKVEFVDEDQVDDEEPDQDEQSEENPDEEKKTKEDEDEEGGDEIKKHNFLIDVKPHNKEGPLMRLYSVAGKDSKLYLDALEFFETEKEALKNDSDENMSLSTESRSEVMDFEAFSPELQDKLCDFFDLLKIDDGVAMFVHVARHESQRQAFISKLQKLQNFIK